MMSDTDAGEACFDFRVADIAMDVRWRIRHTRSSCYRETTFSVSDDWLPVLDAMFSEIEGRPTPGNAASNAASEMGTPESTTSSNRTRTQDAPSDTMANADTPSMTAGRDSQSMNSSAMPGFVGGANAVRNTMRERFVGGGRPDDEAEAAASLVAAFYRTNAQRLGMSVDDL